RQGKIQASSGWERDAVRFQQAGAPFTLALGDQGTITVESQLESRLEDYNNFERSRLREAFGQLEKVLDQENLIQTRKKLRSTLRTAIERANLIATGQVTPTGTNKFDLDVARLAGSGTPFRVDLDENGSPVTTDQSLPAITYDVNTSKIIEAAYQLQELRTTGAVSAFGSNIPNYLTLARSYADKRVAFYFEVNEFTGQITTNTQNYQDLEPDFLNINRDQTTRVSAQWQKDALNFFNQGLPYKLDVRQGQISARQLTISEVTGIRDPQSEFARIQGAIVNLFA
ncbi:MAG: hypothetical protein AAF403_03865, partial [Pseudomonadota bacterium]